MSRLDPGVRVGDLSVWALREAIAAHLANPNRSRADDAELAACRAELGRLEAGLQRRAPAAGVSVLRGAPAAGCDAGPRPTSPAIRIDSRAWTDVGVLYAERARLRDELERPGGADRERAVALALVGLEIAYGRQVRRIIP